MDKPVPDNIKNLALKYYTQLATVSVNPGNIATYINTLKKTIFSYLDKTTYPAVQ